MIAIQQFWTLAICLIGAIQCIFLSSCFAVLRRGNVPAHRLLAVLMLVVGLRLSKSAYYLFDGETMPLWLINIGFAAHLAAGPLLYGYIRSVLGKPLSNSYFLHFLPAVVVLLGATQLSLPGFWYVGGYHGLLVYTLLYWGISLEMLHRNWQNKTALSTGKKRWLLSLMLGLGVFFLAYFANYILRLIPYSLAPVIYSIAIFPVSIAAWRNYESFVQTTQQEPVSSKKYQNIELKSTEIETYQHQILTYLKSEKPYLQADFSLQDLSEAVEIPPHILSNVLNQHLHTNFATLVNGLRIEAACAMLQDSDLQYLKIAAIAYDAGFNSLSVFNQTFKKVMHTTPSAFRKKALAQPKS